MSTDEERTAAFAYQVEVCTQIRKEFPDAYFGNGFAVHNFSDARQAENERITEAFQRIIKKDHPDAQPYGAMYDGRSEYGSSKIAGWRLILDAQRRELEGK